MKTKKSLLSKTALLCATIFIALVVSGCKGRQEGEVTFPPRKLTKPLGMIQAPEDAPKYGFIPTVK
jgi:hypothetical protein